MPEGTPLQQQAQKSSWETPRDLFDELWEEADGFDWDPCCSTDQYTAQRVLANNGTICVLDMFGVRDIGGAAVLVDGLAQPWRGKVFMNPPYGLALRKWVPRAVEMVKNGTAESVWALLPAKTDTQWWQKWVINSVCRVTEVDVFEAAVAGADATMDGLADEVRFLKGRLTFGGAPDPAGFASVVVVWR